MRTGEDLLPDSLHRTPDDREGREEGERKEEREREGKRGKRERERREDTFRKQFETECDASIMKKKCQSRGERYRKRLKFGARYIKSNSPAIFLRQLK